VRGDEPFLTATAGAVRQWRFLPAREGRRAVDSHVLVASVFRAPAMYDLPSDRAAARPSPFPDIPFPLATSTPPYSPLAHGGGIVIVEVLVGENGRVTDAQVVATAPPFDDAAVSAARQWQFQPATLRGSAVPAFAYLVFGFSQPLSSPTARPTGRP
jgi:TonB family protein